jgi:hypothetical protein
VFFGLLGLWWGGVLMGGVQKVAAQVDRRQ